MYPGSLPEELSGKRPGITWRFPEIALNAETSDSQVISFSHSHRLWLCPKVFFFFLNASELQKEEGKVGRSSLIWPASLHPGESGKFTHSFHMKFSVS